MEIKGKVHCLFEQSGTFKNEFIKFGIPAEDYDIQNNFGQTDHINTDRSDSRLSNLRYVTPKENRSNPLTVLNNRRRFGPQRVTEQYLF